MLDSGNVVNTSSFKELKGYFSSGVQLIPLANGRFVSSSPKRGAVQVWDMDKGQCIYRFGYSNTYDKIYVVYKLTDELLLLQTNYSTIKLKLDHQEAKPEEFKAQVKELANGLLALELKENQATEIWDTHAGKHLYTFNAVDLSGKDYAVSGNKLAVVNNKCLEVWNLATAQCELKHTLNTSNTSGKIEAFPNERFALFLSSYYNDKYSVVVVQNNTVYQKNDLERAELMALPNGQWLLKLYSSLEVWDNKLQNRLASHQGSFSDKPLLPNGTWLLHTAKELANWDANFTRCIQSIENEFQVYHHQLLSDSELIFSSNSGYKRFNINTWQFLPMPALIATGLMAAKNLVVLPQETLAFTDANSIWLGPKNTIQTEMLMQARDYGSIANQYILENDEARLKQLIAFLLSAKLMQSQASPSDAELLRVSQDLLSLAEPYQQEAAATPLLASLNSRQIKSSSELALLTLSFTDDPEAHMLVYQILNNTFLNLPFAGSAELTPANSEAYFTSLSAKKQSQAIKIAYQLLQLHFQLLTAIQNIAPQDYFRSLEKLRTSCWMQGFPAMAFYEMAAYVAESVKYLSLQTFTDFKRLGLYLAIINHAIPALEQINQQMPALFSEPLGENTAIFWAAKEGQQPLLYWLLEHTQASIHEKTPQGGDIYQALSAAGHSALKQKLADDAAQSLQRAFAAANSNDDLTVQRLYKTFEFNLTQIQDDKTLLFIFIKQRNLAALRWLVSTGQPFLLEDAGKAAAVLAYELAWPEGVACLNTLQQENACLLHWAVKANDSKMMNYALQEAKLDINSTLADGTTPAMFAVIHNDQRSMLMALIKQGADLSCENHAGETAANIAIRLNKSKLAFLLCAYEDSSLLDDIQALRQIRQGAGQVSVGRAGLFAANASSTPAKEASASHDERAMPKNS